MHQEVQSRKLISTPRVEEPKKLQSVGADEATRADEETNGSLAKDAKRRPQAKTWGLLLGAGRVLPRGGPKLPPPLPPPPAILAPAP